MQYTWIQQNNNQQLILFFNGWACDEKSLAHIKNTDDIDVLIFNDYNTLDIEEELVEKIKQYPKLHIVAWSFGVWIAQYFMEKYELSSCDAVAYNGTLNPIDGQEGILGSIAYATLERLNERNLNKFQRRMLGGGENWQRFQTHMPERDFINQKSELAALYECFNRRDIKQNYFTKAIIGYDDLIFTTQNQHNYWHGKVEVQEIKESHFCFYRYETWKQMID